MLFLGRIAVLTILDLWLLGINVGHAQTCHVNSPRYNLQEDIVTWTMTIADGRSCARGVRFANIQLRSLTLASPPQFGEVVLQGVGFMYFPKANFRGRDMFSLAVTGVVNGKLGNSTIHVTVSDNSSSGPPADAIPLDTTPPSVVFTTPMEGATISGRVVVLAAVPSGNVAIANVRFFIAGDKIGSTSRRLLIQQLGTAPL
jgi:hypothetical protein